MDDQLGYLIPITGIIGLWAFMIIRSLARAKVRELEIRERIAMIEKGHVPAPEVDPRGFERAMVDRDYYRGGAYRFRRAGTTLIGVGLGLMVMITFAGDNPRTGIGVGGFLVMIGLAFLANGMFDRRPIPESPSRPAPSSITPSDAPKLD
jgi:hypothetical protein